VACGEKPFPTYDLPPTTYLNMAIEVFYQKNPNVIQWINTTGNDTGSSVVTATLNDPNGNPVPGATALTLAYTGSAATYQGVTASGSGFNPAAGPGYTLVIDAAVGSASGHWELPAFVQARNVPV
jgi:hypothetical protein